MPQLTRDEIRNRFAASKDFNDIFDAFELAINQEIEDLELYRLLFWNDALGPHEIILFGEKLARKFPRTAYEVYMWMANVFEVLYAQRDNFERSFEYYEKAAAVNPYRIEPYIQAADCYDVDLNIPSLEVLIEFLKRGLDFVSDRKTLCSRLSYLYHIFGDEDLSEYYRVRADDSGETAPL